MAFKIGGEFNLRGNASSSLKQIGSSLRGVKNDGQELGSVLGKTRSSLNAAGSSAKKAGSDAQAGAAGFTAMGNAAQRAGNLAQRAAKNASTAWATTSRTLAGAKSSIAGVFNLPNLLIGGGIGLAGKSIIDAVAYKEQSLIGLTTLLGDSSQALNAFNFAKREAARTPFETKDVIESMTNLKAWNFSAKQIPNTLRALSDTASALNLGKAGLFDLGTIFGKIKGSNTLKLRDVNQLQQRKLDAMGVLANAYHVTRGDISKMITKRQIRGEDAMNILLNFASNRYKGASEKQGQTIGGFASTLVSRPFDLFSTLDADKEAKPLKTFMANLVKITDFNDPSNLIAMKIQHRFASSMGGIFAGIFGPLATSSDPKRIGKLLDPIFDRFDRLSRFLTKNGPGIVSGFKSFFSGIGDTINTVRSSIEWMSGAGSKIQRALEKFGLVKKAGAGGKDGKPGGGPDLLRMGGGLLAGVVGLKFVNGLLGGIPGKLLGGLFGGKSGLGGLLGGVQKVFVVNWPGGGLGSALGGPSNAGASQGGLLGRVAGKAKDFFSSMFGTAQGLAGNVLSKLPAMRSAFLNMVASVGLNSSLLAAKIGQNVTRFAGSFSSSLSSLSGTVLGKLGMFGGSVLSRLPFAQGAMLNALASFRLNGSLLAARAGQIFSGLGQSMGTSMFSFAARYGVNLAALSSTLGTTLSGYAVTFGTAMTGLASSIGATLTGFAAGFSGVLAGMSATIGGQLALAAGAFGIGWGVGTLINKIPVGKDKTGKDMNVGDALTGFFGNTFFGQGKLDAENAAWDKKWASSQQSRKAQQYGLKAGSSLSVAQTALNGLTADWSERTANYCSRFVRQVFEKSTGGKSNGLFSDSAFKSEQLWQKAGLTQSLADVNKSGGLKPGDVLFNKFGGDSWTTNKKTGKRTFHRDGHTGIVTVDPRTGKLAVAENTIRYGARGDYRALTPLERFGRITSVGRYGAGDAKPSTLKPSTLKPSVPHALSKVPPRAKPHTPMTPTQRANQTVSLANTQQASSNSKAGAGSSAGGGFSGGMSGVNVTVNFSGGINVSGANPRAAQQVAAAVKAESKAAVEQAVLEAFERLASRIGGADSALA